MHKQGCRSTHMHQHLLPLALAPLLLWGCGNETIHPETWLSISAGGRQTVGLAPDHTLWAWGWNFMGQLGDGSTFDRRVPTLIR